MTHQTISFIKSALRLFGYMLLPFELATAAVVLLLSEILGIIEEIGH